MDLAALQPIFSALWVVWFFILFAGIIYCVMRPGLRQHYERLGDIPLRDDRQARP